MQKRNYEDDWGIKEKKRLIFEQNNSSSTSTSLGQISE